MVEDADAYLGVYAHAYGSHPDDDPRSYIEIELDRALSLGLTVIPFFMHDDHPWRPSLVDKGENAEKLDRLTRKVAEGRITAWYTSPEDLRGQVIHALSEFEKSRVPPGDKPVVPSFHPPSYIPAAPARAPVHVDYPPR